jgi:hypothetical protein
LAVSFISRSPGLNLEPILRYLLASVYLTGGASTP